MNKKNNKIIFNLILLFSIFALFAAYFVEYVLGHQPCNLCLIERIPYIFAIIIIIFIFVFKKYEKKFIFLLILVFISATMISFYHVGIEQGFIKESLLCELNTENIILTKEKILEQLKLNTVSCKDVTFKIIGLSLATINTLVSFVLSIISIKIFLSYDKNKKK